MAKKNIALKGGNRWFDDPCWNFKPMKVNRDGLASDDKLGEDMIKNLDNYGIDAQQVYENVRDCGNDFRTPELQLAYAWLYPRCASGLSRPRSVRATVCYL